MNAALLKPFGLAFVIGAVIAISGCTHTNDSTDKFELNTEVKEDQQTLQVAESFLGAAGSGDMETLSTLMADDFVWHNEGDPTIPWIGNWEGKDVVLNQFLPTFGAGLQTQSWSTDYSMAMGDQAIFMGTMSGKTTASGAETGVFSWAVRVHVVDGKVKSWNWFEDSFAISKAYHSDSQ